MDVNTYENDFEKQEYSVSTDKALVTYTVKPEKLTGALYEIVPSKGKVPTQLEGRFTSAQHAMATLKAYLDAQKTSKTKERDIKTERRENAKVSTDS